MSFVTLTKYIKQKKELLFSRRPADPEHIIITINQYITNTLHLNTQITSQQISINPQNVVKVSHLNNTLKQLLWTHKDQVLERINTNSQLKINDLLLL